MWEWDKLKWNFDRLTFTQKTNKIKRQKETFCVLERERERENSNRKTPCSKEKNKQIEINKKRFLNISTINKHNIKIHTKVTKYKKTLILFEF